MANSNHSAEEYANDANEFVPGRHYDSFGFCHIPDLGEFGGDIFVLVWRFNDEPNLWTVCMRVRYYAGENTDAFTGGDKKSPWRIFRAPESDPAVVRVKFETVIHMTNLLQGKLPCDPIDWVEINGDSEKAFEVMRTTERPWLHKQTVHLDREPHG